MTKHRTSSTAPAAGTSSTAPGTRTAWQRSAQYHDLVHHHAALLYHGITHEPDDGTPVHTLADLHTIGDTQYASDVAAALQDMDDQDAQDATDAL